jgi:hypothetical protein
MRGARTQLKWAQWREPRQNSLVATPFRLVHNGLRADQVRLSKREVRAQGTGTTTLSAPACPLTGRGTHRGRNPLFYRADWRIVMSRHVQFAACLCLMCGVMAALAQSPPPTSAQPDPKACAPGERLEPSPNGPQPPGTTGRPVSPSDKLDTPSDKLARTDGVICPPPNLDPEIRTPAPDTGTLRVIPPPGSPGGKSDVRPK